MFPLSEYRLEKWREVIGYPGYLVSSMGRIMGLKKTILKPAPDQDGYLTISAYKKGKKKTKRVHHLVAEAFIGPRPDGYFACHVNGRNQDNRSLNIEYATPKKNVEDSRKHGTMTTGENHPNSKITEEDALFIIENYKPYDKGLGSRALAKRFGIAQQNISSIAKGKYWRHVQ